MERLSFFQRSGYHWPCVALATILANDIRAEENDHHPLSLRDEASENGLTYLQVVRYLPHTDLYVARVACDPEALGTSDLLAFFTEAQLTYALPWDVRLQSKCSGEIRTAIDAHAASLRPARARQVHQEGSQQVCPMLPLNPFPEAVEVSREALHDALQATVAEQQGETRQVGVSPTQATQTLQQRPCSWPRWISSWHGSGTLPTRHARCSLKRVARCLPGSEPGSSARASVS